MSEPKLDSEIIAITIGVSAGGLAALSALIPKLSQNLPAAVVIVQHLHVDSDSFLVEHLGRLCSLGVVEVEDKMAIEHGIVYIAPAGYHLLVEECGSYFSLSVDEPVNYARPSIDVLFESAANAWGPKVVGVLLTGANSDGAKGLKTIKDKGGRTIVQNPQEAEYEAMPMAAISSFEVDDILTLKEIGEAVNILATGENKQE